MKIIVEAEVCTGCGDCVPACPVRAVELRNEKAVVDTERCILCTSCIAVCTKDAILIPTREGRFVRSLPTQEPRTKSSS